MRHRRQKRAVGLDQQAVERHHLRDFLQLERAWKRDDAGKREVEAESSARRAIARSPVKQWNTPPISSRVSSLEDAKRVVLRLAGVNHDRQTPLRAPAGSARERPLLHVARREVVVVVETDLAEAARERLRRDHSIGRCRPRSAGSDANLPAACGCTPMENRTAGPLCRNVRPCATSGSSSAARMTSACADTGVLRAFDDVVEIRDEFGAGDVAVGVDHATPKDQLPIPKPRGIWKLEVGSCQRTRAPAGTGSSKLTRIGLPPPTLAASTMPFDSMPISFAGLRLATMTIVRPTSCSG